MVTKLERDAWSLIYRLYEEYVPALREADVDTAGELFRSAFKKISSQWNNFTESEHIILLAGYDLLDAVWKAKK